MSLEGIKDNKFFDKLLVVRGEANLQYMIDQLRECLKSESVVLSKYEVLQLLDIFIRGVFNELRFNSEKELYPIFIMIGHIKIKTDSVDTEAIKTYIEGVNSIKHIFTDEVFNNIIDNIDIVTKEFSIFVNELLTTLSQMFESIDANKNVRSFTGSLRAANNKRLSVMYAIPPAGLNQMVYIIQSNIISDSVNQESLSIIEKTFDEDENFKKYIEKIVKNQTL